MVFDHGKLSFYLGVIFKLTFEMTPMTGVALHSNIRRWAWLTL